MGLIGRRMQGITGWFRNTTPVKHKRGVASIRSEIGSHYISPWH